MLFKAAKYRGGQFLQWVCGGLMSGSARVRNGAVMDSGTSTGDRRALFCEVIGREGIGVELGVFKGTLSAFILAHNQPRRLPLVDPWWKYEAHWHWAIGDTSTVRSFAAMVLGLRKYLESGQVELHVGTSVEALAGFADAYLDWAYVDSTHRYEDTKAELALLKVKVKPSGIIADDDWQEDPQHRHHGVYRAVKEFLDSEPAYTLIFQKGTQWALRRRDAAAAGGAAADVAKHRQDE